MRQNRKAGVALFAMNRVTHDTIFKRGVIEYSFKNGVTAAAIRYKTTRQNIYRWRKKYDGSASSIADCSHRPPQPHYRHIEAEIKLVCDMRRRNPHSGSVVFWVKLRQRDIFNLSPGFTSGFTGSTEKPSNFPIPDTSPNLMNKCNIPVNADKLM